MPRENRHRIPNHYRETFFASYARLKSEGLKTFARGSTRLSFHQVHTLKRDNGRRRYVPLHA